MPKEPYVKPEVKTEILEPEALSCFGSGGGLSWIGKDNFYSSGLCCGHDET